MGTIKAIYSSTIDPQARLVSVGGADRNMLVSHPNLNFRLSPGATWADSFMLPKTYAHNPTNYQVPTGRSDTVSETVMQKIGRIFKMIWDKAVSLALSLYNLAKTHWIITAVIILAIGAWWFGVI